MLSWPDAMQSLQIMMPMMILMTMVTFSCLNLGCSTIHLWRTVPPSLIDDGPKSRVHIMTKWEWLEMPKTGGEPWNMTHSSETEIGYPNGKVVALGVVVICPVDKNHDSKAKNWLFATNIQIFGLKLHIIVLSGQLKPHRSMFSTRKRCLLASLIWGNQTKTT